MFGDKGFERVRNNGGAGELVEARSPEEALILSATCDARDGNAGWQLEARPPSAKLVSDEDDDYYSDFWEAVEVRTEE